MFKNFSLSFFNFFVMVLIATLFSFGAFSKSKNIHIKCQNKLTDKYLYKISYHERIRCQKSIATKDKSLFNRADGKYLSSCTNYELKLKKIKVCKLLQDNGLINWSHQQFINIPKFNTKEGVAYKYSIPCWQYGTHSPILNARYIIKDNILTIKANGEIGHSKFKINMQDLTAGYKDNRDYKCTISFK